ncbi:hypothetical protein NDN08_003658 [Rhodosorus marinus]|uniref:Lipoyl synthase, mitochondrial n=1 Tax=Rhodosorus marinus TaxID=101924 RepID=A0AAV8UX63_9RHOD|nr:hypothetical protein NDN08_003658 [Rhodosorus marinus]
MSYLRFASRRAASTLSAQRSEAPYRRRLEELRKQLASEGTEIDDFFGEKNGSSAFESVDVVGGRTDAYSEPQKPSWLKVRPPGDHESQKEYTRLRETVRKKKLATVCEEARCPNIGECWGGGTATIMIMGDTCTRGCRFCNIKTSKAPEGLDPNEPVHAAEAVTSWGLKYVVITSVDRDDYEDGGSAHIAKTVKEMKKRQSDLLIEVLAPDFRGSLKDVEKVAGCGLDVYAHNLETVERLQRAVRDYRAGYKQSLKTLEAAKSHAPHVVTKTSLMLGVGESHEEIRQTMRDLRDCGVEVVTFGQYLRPSKRHLKVEQWVPPHEFEMWQQEGEQMGFRYVASGPLVRSSYKAGEFYLSALVKERQKQMLQAA